MSYNNKCEYALKSSDITKKINASSIQKAVWLSGLQRVRNLHKQTFETMHLDKNDNQKAVCVSPIVVLGGNLFAKTAFPHTFTGSLKNFCGPIQ